VKTKTEYDLRAPVMDLHYRPLIVVILYVRLASGPTPPFLLTGANRCSSETVAGTRVRIPEVVDVFPNDSIGDLEKDFCRELGVDGQNHCIRNVLHNA
jgi:hypothetical protein